ncbi:MAG: undecaprenyl-diphosphate phosphatase [Dysgonamonadaceae bacterium]|jgi:undecaprenyl-diphosphatase|nr:undecaprenyl-diphosphate phosphatase [Dysgonamonadaceae bacterium]
MEMTWWQTILIAIVEGLTEFLPVSSTGHMIIAQKILNVPSSEFIKAFTVIIQFGAILSVIVLYYNRFLQSSDFYWKLFIAFIPAAVLGFLFSDKIDTLLESVTVVAIMLILGGILMLFVDTWFNKPSKDQTISSKKAFFIGLAQCVAMIPGISRSMATIVGGMAQKLTRKDAAEFSFFLAVPTMFAASAYKLLKLVTNTESQAILVQNIDILIIGNLVAFIVAILAIKFFIGFITKYGFKAFGIYRIIVGTILLILLMQGYDLSII